MTARLAPYYFFYFAVLGIFIPYFNLYLAKDVGFSAAQIGEITAIIMLVRTLTPYIWGWLADRFNWHLGIVQWATFFSILIPLFFLYPLSFELWLVLAAIYTFFWAASLPLFEGVVLHQVNQKPREYSRVRVWGSIGFVLMVWGWGWALDFLDHVWTVLAMVFLTLLAFMASLVIPRMQETQESGENADFQSIQQVLKKPVVMGLFAVFLLMQMGHAIYYTYFSLYMADLGYSFQMIGLLWALGVVAEIAVFFVLHHFFERFSLGFLLWVSLLLAAIRWGVIAWAAEHLWLVLLVQLFHAMTFAVHHAVAMQYISRYFSGRTKGRGQALYHSIAYGFGGVLGSLLGGYLWSHFGGSWAFVLGGVGGLLALALAFWVIHQDEKTAAKPIQLKQL
jgi:PPP family 3-phenylpropionic acid transporter